MKLKIQISLLNVTDFDLQEHSAMFCIRKKLSTILCSIDSRSGAVFEDEETCFACAFFSYDGST